MKKLIAGNWKMNGDGDMAEAFDMALADAVLTQDHVEWLICPPFPYIASLANIQRGGQDCSAYESGAYTGEIAASMLSDMSCRYCIVGHSERRQYHGETDEHVRAKAERLIDNGVIPIICVGETLEEREQGRAVEIVESQIMASVPSSSASSETCVLAYEPVWAIGTGMAATSSDVKKMHEMIRTLLETSLAQCAKMRILYGGSVKPSNAQELLTIDNVDGALIGGASLKVDDFLAIGMALK